ncbi:flavocytochrome c [Clostridium tagluense]|uniref:flavocytochrome c n=1 Tax=Clostridium tagluense TaxID=360422 RepID=UPI001C0D12AF|nr:flavocytochrome c [Clostridium tagluense]MBU3129319.1 flavocytochrome c [Clostridium tagluense]MCB2312368.1 flavocytochrome c [Clostridium tagluense]MCB2317043.1 flavocytochrome c [Clostridium tagluense]MCB2321930.1 flavocytochrome c [Clostridium tagluense]MCB2326845.1 flavocytochrome c [Clostridium tagluense]
MNKNKNTLSFPDKLNSWDEVTDIVVIGSGFAGLTAAIEARNAGTSVIILEKMKAIGGNSIISDGGIAASETKIQKKFNISDSKDMMYADMLNAGDLINYPELVRVVVDNANDAFEWSQEYLGVEYLDRVDQFGGHCVPRCYTAKNISGATIIKKLKEKVEELGTSVRRQMYFKSFIQDSEGRVCGVIVRENYDYQNPDGGRDIYIKAEKGVILAAGGFSSDIEFRMAQDPRLTEKIDTTNKPFATAQALKEALRIGATPVQLSHIQLGPWASPDEKGYGHGPEFSEYILFQYGIIVDPVTGGRFINELADRKILSDKILSVGHPCVGIADSKAVNESGWSIEKCLKKGVVKKFNTIKEFAVFYNISYENLEESLNVFNKSFEQGMDKCFGKPIIDNAKPIMQPPFYGIRLWPKVHYTMGGIRINVLGQVIDLEGKVLEGLYAAGEITGGIHGASRLGSCAITECLVFGRIAGQNAAKKFS